MKKFLPYILILVVVVNLLAPFSVVWKDNQLPKIAKNEAKAKNGVRIIEDPTAITKTDTTISVKVSVEFTDEFNGTTNEGVILHLLKRDGSGIWGRLDDQNQNTPETTDDFTATGTYTGSGTYTFTGLVPDNEYRLEIWAFQTDVDLFNLWDVVTGLDLSNIKDEAKTRSPVTGYTVIKTTLMNAAPETQKLSPAANIDALLPSCSMAPDWVDSITGSKGTFLGCMAQLFYFAVFTPTSFLFGLAGKFFDWAFAYSVTDTSYRSSFVVEGWAIVRDICNIFFIFVLLYAAFKAIFGSHEAKSIIINVIIIGLLINFSLLATRIMVDASNILARLFYTSQAIEVKTDASSNYSRGGIDTQADVGLGEIALSTALVDKVNPQDIIIRSSKITVQDDALGSDQATSTQSKSGGIGVGSFFLITLMASIVNIIGFFVFLSVGLIFISRVIGLWLAMVLSPLAFFSYTVPKFSSAKIFGWKNWWSDTLGLCFVAPIFMFFLYLIILFLDTSFVNIMQEQDGPNWILSIIIPFAFIMILLMTAKKLAKEYSGSIGQTVTGAVTAGGAALLGGAALGAAFVGRRTIGTFMKGASTGDSAAQRFQRGESKNRWDRLKGGAAHYGTFTLGTRLQQAVGRGVNHDQHRVHEIEEGRHLLDETAGTMHHGKKYADLNNDERQEVRDRMDMNNMIRDRAINGTGPGQINYGSRKNWSEMTDQERTLLRRELGVRRTAAGATRAQRRNAGTETFAEQQETNSNRKQSLGSKILQSSRSGSFDVRNLSKITAKEYESGLSKMMHGITSGLAESFRSGMKNMSSLNYGTGQKDFFKDLKNTLSESLKSAKIKVDVGGHGSGGHDDHGGGHDDHGGGHH